MFRPPHTVPVVLAGLCLAVGPVSAQTIDLASTMNIGNGSGNPDTGFLSENAIYGSFAQIARDPDGLYNLANPSQQFGAANLFPNEGDFGVGSLSYDDTNVDGVGVDIAPVTGLDTSLFWQDGSSTTDIGDDGGLDLWAFGPGSTIVFGAPTGTVTFSEGDLVSIDITAAVTFNFDNSFFAPPTSYTGTFSIGGNQLSVLVNDTFGTSTFVADLTGTVNAVIPEPTSLGLLLGAITLGGMRRFSR